MATGKQFAFSGIVESVRFNRIVAAVFVPHHIVLELPRGPIKVKGIINGAPFSVAILYRKESGKYIPLNAALRRSARIEPGDAVNVTFSVISAQKVEIPTELETILNEDDRSRRIWKNLTISVQRVLADYVSVARDVDMRIRRALAAVQKSKAGSLPVQGAKKKKSS